MWHCFFLLFQSQTKQGRPHSPLINYGEIGEKLSAQRFQGTFFGGRGLIDLFNDKAAILNLSDSRSIMGCPGGTRSVFNRAFRAKRELQCIFLGKRAIIITSKHGTTIFFSHYNLFLGKLKEKLARKARVNTDASISDRAHAPWASHNTP